MHPSVKLLTLLTDYYIMMLSKVIFILPIRMDLQKPFLLQPILLAPVSLRGLGTLIDNESMAFQLNKPMPIKGIKYYPADQLTNRVFVNHGMIFYDS